MMGNGGSHHSVGVMGNGSAVVAGNIGKIADYDPLTDGPRNMPNTARNSTTLIYSSDRVAGKFYCRQTWRDDMEIFM